MKFEIITSDCPWRYDFSKSKSREIENQYPTMTVEELCDMNVVSICEKKSVLFLWATSPKIEYAFQVLDAWGFTFKSMHYWHKTYNGRRKGMGYWARGNVEPILIGVRGSHSPPLPRNRVDALFSAPYTGHSVKPQLFYDRVEHMFPDATARLEMFARVERDKWSLFGNEAPNSISI